MSHHSGLKGFSLIEITIALAIIAFALVGIMGLFPVAMQNATESQRETRATFIAQSIFSDLKSGSAPANTFIAIAPNFSSVQALNLSVNSTNCVLFSQDGLVVGTTNAAAFGLPISKGIYGAKVMVAPNATISNLSRVEVQVEAPTSAASSNRTKYNFVTYLRNQ